MTNNLNIHTDTPLAQALLELFNEVAEIALEQVPELTPHSIKAYVLGGCAVHIYTNARGSNDVDAELEASKLINTNQVLLELPPIPYNDPNLGETMLVLDKNFNTSFPSLHPDYQENAILLQSNNVVDVYLLSAVDVAVSKLARYGQQDYDDIVSMYKAKRFSIDEFKAVAYEALDYSATADTLKSHIESAISCLENEQI
ncbi:hypothetical protein DN730_18200 [Marinomonas piezotolerans]|uniref:DUF6036 domain-containing protein n=1 Tax=Marinomonas piezotolerans TaxID=2213058 RepID=A0A370U4Q2_9GAMM|nr:DUF6036 family nucleotidyltransferase [Marinomonas piezotolerans]RDL42752.1 hypothetical protein DN730_18200 [Marinomonas piezotolerans]